MAVTRSLRRNFRSRMKSIYRRFREFNLPSEGKNRDTPITLSGGAKVMFTNRGTLADRSVIFQHFRNHDYDLDVLRRGGELKEFYQSVVASGGKPLIIDCGANIGASALYFCSEFPCARVVCFEPDKANFELLRINTCDRNAEIHNSAIGNTKGRASIEDPGDGAWAYRAKLDPSGAVDFVAISDVVSGYVEQNYTPFIAKIDIEGGEGDLFSEPTTWVDLFPLIIVELHDWMMPKQGTSKSFLKVSSDRNRDFVHLGENIFSIRN